MEEPGCSMCLGMNDDKLKSGQRSASTSNRNFEGRQGAGGRTILLVQLWLRQLLLQDIFMITEKILIYEKI